MGILISIYVINTILGYYTFYLLRKHQGYLGLADVLVCCVVTVFPFAIITSVGLFVIFAKDSDKYFIKEDKE